MSTATHRFHLHDLRTSKVLHPDVAVAIAAALVGALIVAPIAMFAFASPPLVVAFALLGGGLGFLAAGLADAEDATRPT
jgi:hypothetical protein